MENTPQNVAALLEYAGTLALEGGTDLGAALAQARRPRWTQRQHGSNAWNLFLLSDGAVTWGEGDAHALSTTTAPRHALFAYRTGQAGSNTRLLQHLARESGGAVFSVVGESEVEAASKGHRSESWSIQKVSVQGGTDVIIAGRPSAIFPGQRLLLNTPPL